jgi:hypothetical protein
VEVVTGFFLGRDGSYYSCVIAVEKVRALSFDAEAQLEMVLSILAQNGFRNDKEGPLMVPFRGIVADGAASTQLALRRLRCTLRSGYVFGGEATIPALDGLGPSGGAVGTMPFARVGADGEGAVTANATALGCS